LIIPGCDSENDIFSLVLTFFVKLSDATATQD